MQDVDLRDYFRPLVKRWWLIIACTLLAGIAGAIYTMRQPALYRSVTTMMVGGALLDPNPNSTEFGLANQLAKAYADIANRSTVREATREALGLEALPEYSARIIPNSQLIEISVVDEVPERAQAVTHELAVQLMNLTPGNQEDQGRREFIEAQITALEKGILDTNLEIERIEQELPQMFSARQIADARAQMSALESKVSTLQANYAALLENTRQGATNTISVLEPANLPYNRVNNDLAMNVLISALVGFTLAAVGAYTLDYLDNTLREEEDSVRYLDLPALGSIPRISDKGTDANGLLLADDRHTLLGEAYASLRLNIQAAALHTSPPKVLLISSPMAGDGKSTVAANLSIDLARSGQKVILVDGDLYKPSQHRLFHLDNRGGTTTHLLDSRVPLSSLLQRTQFQGLSVLTSGPIVSNPTPLLARDLKQDLFAGLEEIADLIVIDTPPLTAVASASILSKYVDGVIVVIRAGHTKRNLAQRAVKSLRQIHAPLLGVIVYDTPLKQSIYGSSYGYQPDLEEVRSSNPHGNPFRMRGSRTGRSATLHGTNGNPQRHGAVSRAE